MVQLGVVGYKDGKKEMAKLEEIVKLIVDNGIGVACVIFLIYFINSTMKDNNKILDQMQQTLVAIKTTLDLQNIRIEKLENKIEKK